MEKIKDVNVWIGQPEFRMMADYLRRPIAVLYPDKKELIYDKFYWDVYEPKSDYCNVAPLIIKGVPNHFQVKCLEKKLTSTVQNKFFDGSRTDLIESLNSFFTE